MAVKLSPRALAQLAVLDDFERRADHLHALVETFAAEKRAPDRVAQTVKREFGRLKYQLTAAGYDAMGQLCGGLEVAARRGISHLQKTRILREGVGSLRLQLDMTRRGIVAEEDERERRERSVT